MIHVLDGARHREMVEWCDEHLLSRTEIGRHVFSTAAHEEHHLRGRRGPVRFVLGLPSDPRPFRHPLALRSRREQDVIEVAHRIHFASPEEP